MLRLGACLFQRYSHPSVSATVVNPCLQKEDFPFSRRSFKDVWTQAGNFSRRRLKMASFWPIPFLSAALVFVCFAYLLVLEISSAFTNQFFFPAGVVRRQRISARCTGPVLLRGTEDLRWCGSWLASRSKRIAILPCLEHIVLPQSTMI